MLTLLIFAYPDHEEWNFWLSIPEYPRQKTPPVFRWHLPPKRVASGSIHFATQYGKRGEQRRAEQRREWERRQREKEGAEPEMKEEDFWNSTVYVHRTMMTMMIILAGTTMTQTKLKVWFVVACSGYYSSCWLLLFACFFFALLFIVSFPFLFYSIRCPTTVNAFARSWKERYIIFFNDFIFFLIISVFFCADATQPINMSAKLRNSLRALPPKLNLLNACCSILPALLL